jgi:uncharacterized protein YkwD
MKRKSIRARLRTVATSVAVSLLAASVLEALPAVPAARASTTTAAWSQAVYQLLNRERAAHGLAALRWNSALASAAHRHSVDMASHNLLSHQLPGELSLGARVTAAGYRWVMVGENIAFTTNVTQTGLLALQRMLYAEVAPNDGHRRNILNKYYRDIGIDVVLGHGKAWLTEDFGRHA